MDNPIKPIGTAALLGRQIGPYRLLERLGAGGMGTVYSAEHTLIERKVALKVLSPELAALDGAVDRFLLEARSASRIGHEHVIDVYDLGQTPDGYVYMAMELLHGADLGTVLEREGSLPWSRARGIARQMSAALAAAHAKNIIHRDLKPENIFLITRAGRTDFVKILDFGIAKVLTSEGPRITRTGVIGTPEFMAPEQIEGKSLDGRTDIYALGCVLYQMITGLLPFEAESMMALFNQRLTGTPVPLAQRRPDLTIPAALDALIMKALERDPANRWQNMLELLAALEACEVGPATAPAPAKPATNPRGPARPRPADDELALALDAAPVRRAPAHHRTVVVDRFRLSRRSLALAAAAGAVLLISAILLFARRSPAPGPSAASPSQRAPAAARSLVTAAAPDAAPPASSASSAVNRASPTPAQLRPSTANVSPEEESDEAPRPSRRERLNAAHARARSFEESEPVVPRLDRPTVAPASAPAESSHDPK
jgi:serine/threonine-protein kinase